MKLNHNITLKSKISRESRMYFRIGRMFCTLRFPYPGLVVETQNAPRNCHLLATIRHSRHLNPHIFPKILIQRAFFRFSAFFNLALRKPAFFRFLRRAGAWPAAPPGPAGPLKASCLWISVANLEKIVKIWEIRWKFGK